MPSVPYRRKNTGTAVNLRDHVYAYLIAYRDDVLARSGPDSLLLRNFGRIDSLAAGLPVQVRGYEVADALPRGSVAPSAVYTLTPDDRLFLVSS